MLSARFFTVCETVCQTQGETERNKDAQRREIYREFPGGPGAKTLHVDRMGGGFHSWSGN